MIKRSLLFQPESYKLLVNGDKQEGSMISEERKDLSWYLVIFLFIFLSFFFFFSPFLATVRSLDLVSLSDLSSNFFLLRCFHGNSLDIKTRFHDSSLLYALLRHKRTVVKRTIVNTIEQRASPHSYTVSLFAFPCVIPLLCARTILVALCWIRYAVGFTRIIYDGLLSSI